MSDDVLIPAVSKINLDGLRRGPPYVEGRDICAKTPVKKISLETDFHILDLFRFEGVESRWCGTVVETASHRRSACLGIDEHSIIQFVVQTRCHSRHFELGRMGIVAGRSGWDNRAHRRGRVNTRRPMPVQKPP